VKPDSSWHGDQSCKGPSEPAVRAAGDEQDEENTEGVGQQGDHEPKVGRRGPAEGGSSIRHKRCCQQLGEGQDEDHVAFGRLRHWQQRGIEIDRESTRMML